MKRTRALTPSLLLIALWLAPALASAQTGVDDDRVSLPEGPGSLEGVGENVEIDPNMALMRWNVPIEVPRGHDGLTPALALNYSSGSGSGITGLGWSMSMPTIERMTSRGVPRYTTADRFVKDGGTELIYSGDLTGDRVYRERYEESFSRYRWVNAGADGYWIVEMPDGIRAFYGADKDGNLATGARTHGPDGTYRYHLVDMVDVFENRTHYVYDSFSGDVPLLTDIQYGFVGDTARYVVQFSWEDRPDLLSDCGAGFNELLRYRLGSVRVLSSDEIVREVVLTYEDTPAAGGASRLGSVRTYGAGGVAGGELYPVRFDFGYSRALGATCDANATDCERPYLVDMGALTGSVNLAAGNATLIDINGDGLPDVLDTSGAGPHRFFINTLTPDGAGFTHGFSAPLESQIATGASFQLIAQNVQTLDINGDGYADLLDTTNGNYLLNGGQSTDWTAPGTGFGTGTLPSFTGDAFQSLRFTDYNNDKKIDVIQSTAGETRVYRNNDEDFVNELVDQIGAGFDGSSLQLSDMNGDGLNDPVEILSGGSVRYKLNLGLGHWEPAAPTDWLTIPGIDIPPSEQDQVDLEDLNGDGLSDLVIVTTTAIKVALNRNANRFDPFVTITSADIDGDIPERASGVTVLFADMNGNGSEDVVWFDTNGGVRYLELFPIRPHLISRIENGLGMVQKITYGASVEHAARAAAAGQPWEHSLPNPMLVVDRLDIFVTLTGDDDGSGVHEVIDYTYRNGFYDGDEKQFRGFSDVVTRLHGDDFQEEGLTTTVYDNGVDDPYLNGKLLRQRVESAGRALSAFAVTYADCLVAEVPTPAQMEAMGRPPIRHLCETARETVVMEGAPDADHLTTRTEQTWDGYGNVTIDASLGVVARGGTACGADCLGDEDYTATTFVTPANTGGRWILHEPATVSTYTDPNDPFKTEERYYYDGDAFAGLPSGQLTHGFLSRMTRRVSPASDAVVNVTRQRRDSFGNVVERLDPNGDPAEPNAHRRLTTFDDAGILLTSTTLMLTDDAGQPYQLKKEYLYEPRFQNMAEASDWIILRDGALVSQPNAVRYRYDAFGRLTDVLWPGDTAAAPTQHLAYDLRAPVSRVTTVTRAQQGPDLIQHRCFDGRGRLVQTRDRTAEGHWQVDGFTVYNNRGTPVQEFQPFTSEDDPCSLAPPTGVKVASYRYDATGRQLEITAPDADLYGTASISRTVYGPLTETITDAEDNDPTSPHADTPTVRQTDGLGRLTAVSRSLRDGQSTEAARYTFDYDNIGNLTAYTGPLGHTFHQTFDLLGRVVEVEDPNMGTTHLTWDDAGNLLTRTDARGDTVVHTWDGNNRLASRYEEGAREATLITWRYDADPDCPLTDCTNGQGRLVTVTYPLANGDLDLGRAVEHTAWDVRRRAIADTRTYGDITLRETTTWDGANRVANRVMPDGTELSYTWDGLSRLTSVAGYIDSVEYEERGLIGRMNFSNGAIQEYTWDDLLRLAGLAHLDADAGVIAAWELGRDRDGNLVDIIDAGPAVPGFPSQDAHFTYDDFYRPTTMSLSPATDAAETLTARYDLIDRIMERSSSLGAASRAHIGTYGYDGESLQGATSAGALSLGYDDAGHVIERADLDLAWDYQGRLTLAAGVRPFSALYGPDERRVIKIDDGTLTFYGPGDFAVVDGVGVTYVRLNDQRVARHESTDFGPAIYPDLAPGADAAGAWTPAPDAEINAADAWIVAALDAGVLTGNAPTMDVDLILAAAARRLLAELDGPRAFFHADHLGSLIAATDESGHVRGRAAWYPFGESRGATGYVDRRGFTQQERDEATGLLHFQFRSYDTSIGRWLSADPGFATLAAETLADKLGDATAGYAYVGNNPINAIDPLGLEGKSKKSSKSKSKDKKARKFKKGSVKETKAAVTHENSVAGKITIGGSRGNSQETTDQISRHNAERAGQADKNEIRKYTNAAGKLYQATFPYRRTKGTNKEQAKKANNRGAKLLTAVLGSVGSLGAAFVGVSVSGFNDNEGDDADTERQDTGGFSDVFAQ